MKHPIKAMCLKETLVILSFLIFTFSCSQSKNELYSKEVKPGNTSYDFSKFTNDNDSTKIDEYKVLTSKGKLEYIKVLNSFNWFEQKNEIKKKEIIKTIENDLETNYSFLALEDLNFDTEGFETAESYKNLINNLIKVARIQNQIKNIEVSEKKNLINISITTNENEELKYSVDINENQDWIDTNVIQQLINEKLLPRMNTNKKFIGLPAIDQIANLIFISQDDFEKARKIGLIPTDDFFME